MYVQNIQIPPVLLDITPRVNDVSILIGENGSGKSQLLSRLTREYLNRRKMVVAISNSIHDKFPDSGRNLHLLRDRAGRKKTKRSVKNALLNIPADEISRLKMVSQALEIVGYEPYIGIHRVTVTESQFLEELELDENREKFDRNEINSIRSLLAKSYSSEEIIWLSLFDFSFGEIDKASFIELLRYEHILRKLGLIDEIEISLRKQGQVISLFDASSGELSFISSIIYLSTVLRENAVILIDEPENSLHPRWQKDYIKTLLELFYLYQPKILIATHSALIVTGAEVINPSTRVFECSHFQFIEKQREPLNIEEAFISYFNVLTPQNRYLSDYVINMLNNLAERNTSLEEVITEINQFQKESFEPRQLSVLDGLKEIANRIANPDTTITSNNKANE